MAQSIVVPADDPRGKLAIMHWRVLARTAAGTWLEMQLETGRTHQIRVQAASRGHAVVGDTQYGATQPFGEQFEDERLRSIALACPPARLQSSDDARTGRRRRASSGAWQTLELPEELMR